MLPVLPVGGGNGMGMGGGPAAPNWAAAAAQGESAVKD